MSELERYIREAIRKRVGSPEIEVVELLALPKPASAAEAVSSLQDAIRLFDSPDERDVNYIVKVRKPMREVVEAEPKLSAFTGKPNADGIYDTRGKINVPFLLKNGELLLASGDFQLAKNIFQALRKSGEASPEACLGLGRCYEGLNQNAEAQACYEESVAFKPSFAAFQRLIGLMVGQQKHQYVAELCERALKLQELSRELICELHKTAGNAFTRLERNDEAEKHFRQALDANPSADEIQSNLGAVYLQAGKIPMAKKSFRDALAANPANANAYFGLGCCLLIEREKVHGYESLCRSLELNIQNPRALFYLIKTAYEIRHFAPAEKLLNQYVQSGPINPSLLYALAGMQYHLGRKDAARATAFRILTLKGDHKGAQDLVRLAR